MIEPQGGQARENPSAARTNFILLALNHISLRVGWIFKTESVIIPAFLDSLGASSWQRGLLPTVARIGQSLPQFVVARWVSGRPIYKYYAFLSTALQAFPWLVLAFLLHQQTVSDQAMLWLFLFLYTFHWFVFGSYALLSGVLQGKLVVANLRGRLLASSNFIGCILSVIAALILMPGWMSRGDSGYGLVFLGTAIGFILAAVAFLPLVEAPARAGTAEDFRTESWKLLRSNGEIRRLIAVMTLSYASLLLFPHYEKFGSSVLKVHSVDRVKMVVIQNVINAFGSAFIGPIADRKGNRLALTIAMGMIGLAPLLAVVMSYLPEGMGSNWYWLVFGLVGFNPVTGRVLVNYILEFAPEGQHPLYLGTLNLVQVVPLLFSPFVGVAIDLTSFQTVFMFFALIMFAGAVLSMSLEEPRLRNSQSSIRIEA